MKKIFYCLLAFLGTIHVLCADDGGGRIGENLQPFQPGIIRGTRVFFNDARTEVPMEFLLVVFFRSPDADLQEIELILQESMAGRGNIVHLSGAPADMLQSYCSNLPAGLEFMTVAYDHGDAIAKRVLPGNVVLPFAVLADRTGEILWMGEPMEFPDVFPAITAGTYDNSKRAAAIPYYSNLASAIRSGKLETVRTAAAPILQMEPENPTAVQALMFFLEQSGNTAEAWQILQNAMDAAPESRFLTMLAINFGTRELNYASVIPGMVKKEVIAGGSDREKLSAAFLLLNGYGFEITALDLAEEILASVKEITPEVLEFRALCAYRHGNPAAAAEFQKQAIDLSVLPDDGMNKRLEFYQTLAARMAE